MPILKPRHAIFCNYHDPAIPLQSADIKGNRYHPLRLNAAFLGNLSAEDQRVLGFGDARQQRTLYRRPVQFPLLDSGYRRCLQAAMRLSDLKTRLTARARRMLGA